METVLEARMPSMHLSERDFGRLRGLISSVCGIKMPPSKKSMLQARLQKRIRLLGMKSLVEYCDYLFSDEGMECELLHMLDSVTTNKTDFFREPSHFEYLTGNVLPAMLNPGGYRLNRPLKVWSAGCSTGEEPYTIAMVLNEFALGQNGFDYSITATDISTRAIEKARVGIYPAERVEPVPAQLKRRYLMRSRDKDKNLVRVIPELRAKVKFKRLNFMSAGFDMPDTFDVIFMRNVLIYFERSTQQDILDRILRHLRPDGILLVGHSETLHGLRLPVVQEAPTVYRKIGVCE